jgi:hypothetical protein
MTEKMHDMRTAITSVENSELKKTREKERKQRGYEGFKLGARYLTVACTLKKFTAVIYRFFAISKRVCPWQAFPA